MDLNQKKLVEEQMNRIPAEVRDAILASDWERTVFNIGRAHKLHLDEIDSLSIETILTMIGLEHPQDFSRNLQKHTKINNETLYEIVEEINTKLFFKIRRALKEYYEKVATGEIMAQDEKDELHYAGIEIDGHAPPPPKQKKEENQPAKEESKPEVKNPKENVLVLKIDEDEEEKTQDAPVSKENKDISPPEKKYPTFDPYREPPE